jgi:hypothetical protein
MSGLLTGEQKHQAEYLLGPWVRKYFFSTAVETEPDLHSSLEDALT